MDKPKITWHVETEAGLLSKKEYHAGTYAPGDVIKIKIQVWNNRWGVENAPDLRDAVVNMYFNTVEDSALLSLCSLEVDDMGTVPMTIRDTKASARLGRNLLGLANDGNPSKSANRENFTTLTFSFDAKTYRMKENDLKSLYFEMVSAN